MNKLAILGKLPTKFKAPFNDPHFDIWAFNFHNEELPRVDVWFDIHQNGYNPKADIKRADFPFLEVNNMLGGNYFNNTASYLIAYAILKGYKEIYLYGMQFQTDEEKRKKEYANVREIIFFAKGKGIKVFAPYDEVMLKTYPIYGA